MSDFTKKNADRRKHRDAAAASGQMRTFKKARDARRGVNGAFGRADKDDYDFMAFGTNAGPKMTAKKNND